MPETPPRIPFRREHPVFFWGTFALLLLFVGGAAVVGSRVPRYRSEAAEINARLDSTERAARDRILQSRAKRSELAVALLQRDVRIRQLSTKGVHIAINTEDSTLSLNHGKATMRKVRIRIGADSTVKAPDGRTWRMVRALGERRLAEKQANPVYTIPEWVYVGRGEPVPAEEERKVQGGLGRYVLRLDDGTEIHTEPQVGPLKGTVKPASFVARAADLAAIYDAVRVDTPVFIF